MKEHVDLLFNPIFVLRLVCLGISLVNKSAEVCQVINKIKQLTDIICDRGAVGIHSLQMFFIHFTNTFHTLIHRFIVSVSSAFWPLGRLYQQGGVRHRTKSPPAADADSATAHELTPLFSFLTENQH